MAFVAGMRLTADLLNDTFPEEESDTQNTSGTTTSSTYTATLTGGTACGLTFVAPRSGKVLVTTTADIRNSTTGRSYCSWIIKTGATIGSGTTFLDGGDNAAASVVGTSGVMSEKTYEVTGLTPGSTYNVRQQFRNNAGGQTGTFERKSLVVQPVI